MAHSKLLMQPSKQQLERISPKKSIRGQKSQTQGTAKLIIVNATPNVIAVAVAYYHDSQCDGLRVVGWFNVQPGDTQSPLTVVSRYAYCYAEDGTGPLTGNSGVFVGVTNNAFEYCIPPGPPTVPERTVELDLVDFGGLLEDITMRFDVN